MVAPSAQCVSDPVDIVPTFGAQSSINLFLVLPKDLFGLIDRCCSDRMLGYDGV